MKKVVKVTLFVDFSNGFDSINRLFYGISTFVGYLMTNLFLYK